MAPLNAEAMYPIRGTNSTCIAIVMTTPIIEKYAPHCVLSVNLYQKLRLHQHMLLPIVCLYV